MYYWEKSRPGRAATSILLVLLIGLAACAEEAPEENVLQRPNILLILTDDQSAVHTGMAGYPLVNTPNFDRLAEQGVYFENAFAAAPSCLPSRSALLSGQQIWRLGSSAVHKGDWSDSMLSYQLILAEQGYRAGYTGKSWSPGGGPPPVPALGKSYNREKRAVDTPFYSELDYVANFRRFLDRQPKKRPFVFWMGIREPHLPSRVDDRSRFADVERETYLPDYLPGTLYTESHLQGYLEEIEHLDRDIGDAVALLEERGLLENTLVIVTSDNGMPFARGKLNNYLLGVQVPLLVYWPRGMAAGRALSDVVSLTDIAPTILAAAGVDIPAQMTGSSLLPLITEEAPDWDREEVYSAFERHRLEIRPDNVGYSRRALHRRDWLYIRNNFPQRWPLGAPPEYPEAYLSNFIDENTDLVLQEYLKLTVAKRPAEELYYLPDDPYQLSNLAGRADYQVKRQALARSLDAQLEKTGDPVYLTGEDRFSQYAYRHGSAKKRNVGGGQQSPASPPPPD